MGNFQVSGDPRFQSPPTAYRLDIKGKPAISTHANFRQFEWLARITMKGSEAGSFEAGFIQNMLKCSIDLDYSTGDGDQSPVAAQLIVKPLPILDSKLENSVWLGGNFGLLGAQSVGASEILPPGFQRTWTNKEANVSGGDDPGGRFPMEHPQQPGKMLRRLREQLDFVTWVAVRNKAKPERDVASYELIRYVSWVVRRNIIIHYNPSGNFAFAFVENSTKAVSSGNGQGPQTPVVTTPIANSQVEAKGIVLR